MRMLRFATSILFGFGVFAGGPVPAWGAGPGVQGFELADAYFRRGNFASAYLTGLPVAQAGDPRAQYLLGLMSFHGLWPVARDVKEAMRWFAAAAAKGHAEAQYALAQGHARGDGVPLDARAALAWLRRAAEAGHGPATISLARLHDEGIDMPRDRAAATRWIRRAAERGDTRAQVLLAERLAAGIGAPADPLEAEQWRDRAAAAAEPLALLGRVRVALADPGASREDLVEAHAAARAAEALADGKLREEAVAAKAALAQRLTPADLAEAAERAARLRQRAGTQ
jgi:TPR repeat protein